MNDYMRALHQQFCRKPDCPEVERELDNTYRILRESVSRQDRELLLRVRDLETELREETSLASFAAGLRLGFGLAGELKPYSFEDDQEERARKTFEAEQT